MEFSWVLTCLWIPKFQMSRRTIGYYNQAQVRSIKLIRTDCNCQGQSPFWFGIADQYYSLPEFHGDRDCGDHDSHIKFGRQICLDILMEKCTPTWRVMRNVHALHFSNCAFIHVEYMLSRSGSWRRRLETQQLWNEITPNRQMINSALARATAEMDSTEIPRL